MTSQRSSRCFGANVAVVLLAIFSHTGKVSSQTSNVSSQTTSSHTSDVTRTSKSLLTSLVTSSSARNVVTTERRVRRTTMSLTTTTGALTTSYSRRSSAVVQQTTSRSDSPTTTSSDGPKHQMQTTDSGEATTTNRTSTHATGRLNRTVPTTVPTTTTTTLGIKVTSLPLYTGSMSLAFTDKPLDRMTSQWTSEMPVNASQIGIIVPDSSTDYSSGTVQTTAALGQVNVSTKTLMLAIGLGVGLGLAVLLLLFVIIAVSVSAKRRRRHRRSDRRKLTPRPRNYDRVIHPSQVTSSPQTEQQSNVRPGPRGSRASSSQAAADVHSPPSPNGSVDQASIDIPTAPTAKPRPKAEKRSTKNDKPHAARRLRGKPPELQTTYFVADDDVSPRESSDRDKTAASDPFWEASEAPHFTPRRASTASEGRSTGSLFKPSSSSGTLGSTGGAADNSTSELPMTYLLLSPGNIGETTTDTGARRK